MSTTTTRSAREADSPPGSGLPTGAASAARWRPSATAASTSGCCTPTATATSRSPPAADRRAPSCASRPARTPATSCAGGASGASGLAGRAARARRPPRRARRGGLRRPGGTPRARRRQGARQPHPAGCGSTSTGATGCPRSDGCCGESPRSSSSSPRARAACTATGGCAARCAATRSRQAHERLIYALGYELRDGRPVPSVADAACKDRSRVMRLAGTVNGKSGRCARIVSADLAHAGWALDELLADLPATPRPRRARGRSDAGTTIRTSASRRPSTSAGWPASRCRPAGSCDARARCTTTPRRAATSAATPAKGFCCHGCGIGGAIYDLASALEGGATGRWLRGDAFRRARERVRVTFDGA